MWNADTAFLLGGQAILVRCSVWDWIEQVFSCYINFEKAGAKYFSIQKDLKIC